MRNVWPALRNGRAFLRQLMANDRPAPRIQKGILYIKNILITDRTLTL
jgi:hypothetical protein